MPTDELNALFHQYYVKYSDIILNLCFIKLKSRPQNAEDCVQEAFSTLYKKMLAGENIENIGGFLYQTAHNYIKLEYREYQKDNRKVSLDDVAYKLMYEQDFSERISDKKIIELKDEILSELSPKERLLLEKLNYTPDGKHTPEQQIADELNCNIGALRQRISVLRKKVQRIAIKKSENL